MRLSTNDTNQIITALTPFIKNKTCELRLFGSRINDEAKGGDIDLLLIIFNEDNTQDVLLEKHRILADIKKNIGDQKIDLVIALASDLDKKPFLSLIYPQSILLKQWGSI